MIKSCLPCLSHLCYATSSIEGQSLVQAFRKRYTRKEPSKWIKVASLGHLLLCFSLFCRVITICLSRVRSFGLSAHSIFALSPRIPSLKSKL